MAEPRRGRAPLILAVIILALALLVLGILVVSAARDGVWQGRLSGLVIAAVALAVGAAMLRPGKPGESHYWSLVGVLALGALVVGAYSYKPKTPQAGNRAEAIPMEVGGWRGVADKVPQETIDVLRTKDIIMRRYQRGSDEVGLAVIFAMSKRKVAHPPEQCYAALGYEMEKIRDDSLLTKDGRVVRARRLVMRYRGQSHVAFYWYKAGDLNTPSFFRQQLHIILSSLLMRSEIRVALIRFTATLDPGHGNGEERAVARIKEFAAEIFPYIEEKLQ